MTNLKERYSAEKYGERTAETMGFLIESMYKTFIDIDPAWIASLDQLAMDYEMLYQAYDDIKANGNITPASRERLSRNPSIGLFLNCQNAIQTILSKTGLTVLSKAKVKQLMRDEEEPRDEFADNFLK